MSIEEIAALAAIVALVAAPITIIAYRHPWQYREFLLAKLHGLALAAVVGITAWNSAINTTKRATYDAFQDVDVRTAYVAKQAIEEATERHVLSMWWLLLIFLALAYCWFLQILPQLGITSDQK